MNADDWKAHFDAIYDDLGVAATLSPNNETNDFDVTVVDATLPVEDGMGGVTVSSISPRVCIRVTELAELSINRDTLRGGTLDMGDKAWRIENTVPKPGPVPGSGEVILVLVEDA